MVMSLAPPAVCRFKWNLTNASCGHRFSQALDGRPGFGTPALQQLERAGYADTQPLFYFPPPPAAMCP